MGKFYKIAHDLLITPLQCENWKLSVLDRKIESRYVSLHVTRDIVTSLLRSEEKFIILQAVTTNAERTVFAVARRGR